MSLKQKMEDIISLVLTGCKLAQELESNLGRLNGMEDLLEKCEQISGAFTAASQGLREIPCHVTLHGHEDVNLLVPAVEEEMKIPVEQTGSGGPTSEKGKEVIMQVPNFGGIVDGARGELRLQAPYMVVKGGAASGSSSSTLQKSRKRNDGNGKWTIEVEAPLHGNTEIPPDDGYTWRKYGQKEILGALFPRGYFRCSHQRLYNCPAKKQVQRLNHNPRIFQVIYRGHHICHMNSTAPAAALPPPVAHHDRWLSIDPSLNVVVGQGGRDHQGDLGANVVDMADAMFNSSAGSADDGIDFIFSNK